MKRLRIDGRFASKLQLSKIEGESQLNACQLYDNDTVHDDISVIESDIYAPEVVEYLMQSRQSKHETMSFDGQSTLTEQDLKFLQKNASSEKELESDQIMEMLDESSAGLTVKFSNRDAEHRTNATTIYNGKW